MDHALRHAFSPAAAPRDRGCGSRVADALLAFEGGLEEQRAVPSGRVWKIVVMADADRYAVTGPKRMWRPPTIARPSLRGRSSTRRSRDSGNRSTCASRSRPDRPVLRALLVARRKMPQPPSSSPQLPISKTAWAPARTGVTKYSSASSGKSRNCLSDNTWLRPRNLTCTALAVTTSRSRDACRRSWVADASWNATSLNPLSLAPCRRPAVCPKYIRHQFPRGQRQSARGST